MKPRIIIPGLVAIAAAGGALFTLQAQDRENPKSQRKFGAEYADVQRGPLRFEFRDDGSGARFFKNGKEITPEEGDSADPFADMRKQMEEMMRHMGQGPGADSNPFEDLLKQMRGRNGQQGQGNSLPELMRRMQLQQRNSGGGEVISRFSKHHRTALAEWRPLVKTVRESTVRILRDNKQVAFGTIVSADGYALTKASEVAKTGEAGKEALECEFHDGRIVSAKVVDKLDAYDLALIKLEASGLTPATFCPDDAKVGTIVAAVGLDEDPLAVGVISVASRSLSEKSKGALGIQFSPTADESQKGVLIGKVLKNCAAEQAGLKDGDLILSVNGAEVDFPGQLQNMIAAMTPGDSVKVLYSRNGKVSEIEFPLSCREDLVKIQQEEAKEDLARLGLNRIPDRRESDPTAMLGSTLSSNYSGYPNAVQSDLPVDSDACGGPVVDVDGHVVAINIARAERVSTYMIPGKVVQSLLTDVQSGKFTLSKDADTLQGEVREYNAAIRKAQEAVREAEARRAEAEQALKKFKK